jgi:hypothetical protein
MMLATSRGSQIVPWQRAIQIRKSVTMASSLLVLSNKTDFPGLCRSKRRLSCALTIGTIGRLMTTLNPALARVLKRLHYPLDVMLTCVRWYVAYPLSLRHLEE